MSMRPLDLLRAARDLPGTSVTEHAVLVALVLRADSDGCCWPSFETLAKDAHLCPRTAKSAVAALVKAGHIRVEQRTKDGLKTSNRYVVQLSHIDVQPLHDDVQEPHFDVQTTVAPDVQQLHEGSAAVAHKLPNELPKRRTAHRERPSAVLVLEPPQGKVSRKKSNTQAPASDAPLEEIEAWCKRWAIPDPASNTEAASFLDYHRARAEGRADWSAAWRNWHRRSSEFTRARPYKTHQVQQQSGPRTWRERNLSKAPHGPAEGSQPSAEANWDWEREIRAIHGAKNGAGGQ